MTSVVVGYGCAALCVALLAFSIWASATGAGDGVGLVAVALAFALLMVCGATLRDEAER